MSKKNRNKQTEKSDSTAFTKSDWYGKGKRGRSRKKPKNKTYQRVSDKYKLDKLPDDIVSQKPDIDTNSKNNNEKASS